MDRRRTYFILCTETGRVKIGVSIDPLGRLECFQVGSPTRLALVATLDGDVESAWHQYFSWCHSHGEWFDLNLSLSDSVDGGMVSEKLQQVAEMRGWTQAELAERVGIDHTGISHLESGRRENVQIDTLMRLADALEVTPQWLLKPWI